MKTSLKIVLSLSLFVQPVVQAVDASTIALGTGVALCAAGYRSASKDAKPEKDLATWSSVEKNWNTSWGSFLKALATYIDDRIIGQDEQGAIITDFAPITLKDAATGQNKTVYLGEGTIKYAKAQGIGALNKKIKYINSGLSVTQKAGGLIILGVLGYRYMSGSKTVPQPSDTEKLCAGLGVFYNKEFKMPGMIVSPEGKTELQMLAQDLRIQLLSNRPMNQPAGAAVENAVTAVRNNIGAAQLGLNGIGSLCPYKG